MAQNRQLEVSYSTGESNLGNYSAYYESWDERGKTCPDCKGTGLDRDEWFDCETCGGEGEISFVSDILDTRQSAKVQLS